MRRDSRGPTYRVPARRPLHIIQSHDRCKYRAGVPPLDMDHIVSIETSVTKTGDGHKCGAYAAVWYGQIRPALIESYIGDNDWVYLHLLAIATLLRAYPNDEAIGFVTRCKGMLSLFNGEPLFVEHKEQTVPLIELIINMVRTRPGRVQVVYNTKQVNGDVRTARVAARIAMKDRVKINLTMPWSPGEPELLKHELDYLINRTRKERKAKESQPIDKSAFYRPLLQQEEQMPDIQLSDGSAFHRPLAQQEEHRQGIQLIDDSAFDQQSAQNQEEVQDIQLIDGSAFDQQSAQNQEEVQDIQLIDGSAFDQQLAQNQEEVQDIQLIDGSAFDQQSAQKQDQPPSQTMSTSPPPKGFLTRILDAWHEPQDLASSSEDKPTRAGPEEKDSSSSTPPIVPAENRNRLKRKLKSRRSVAPLAATITDGYMGNGNSAQSIIDSIEMRLKDARPPTKRLREESQDNGCGSAKKLKVGTGQARREDEEEETATSWMGGIAAAFRRMFG